MTPHRIGVGAVARREDGRLARLMLVFDCPGRSIQFVLDEIKAAALVGQLEALLLAIGVPPDDLIAMEDKARDLMVGMLREDKE